MTSNDILLWMVVINLGGAFGAGIYAQHSRRFGRLPVGPSIGSNDHRSLYFVERREGLDSLKRIQVHRELLA